MVIDKANVATQEEKDMMEVGDLFDLWTTTNCKLSSCSEAEHHTPDIPWVTKKMNHKNIFQKNNYL